MTHSLFNEMSNSTGGAPDESTDLSPADFPGHRNTDEGFSYLIHPFL